MTESRSVAAHRQERRNRRGRGRGNPKGPGELLWGVDVFTVLVVVESWAHLKPTKSVNFKYVQFIASQLHLNKAREGERENSCEQRYNLLLQYPTKQRKSTLIPPQDF